MNEKPQRRLRRSLSLWQITLYGIGTILGAGIYVLIGEVAAVAGVFAPLSFLLAAALAGITGLSFAELSSRFPLSAGEAVYVQQAFSKRHLSAVIGILVVLTGVVSGATLVNGFAGYFREFVPISNIVIVPIVCAVLGGIAAWGISQSITIAVVITVAEVLGLIVVVLVALPDAITATGMNTTTDYTVMGSIWFGVISGAGIAFYAFIGFEDMVNVAEEVKNVRRVMPRAILITIAFTSLLYAGVAIVAVRAVPLEALTQSEAPIALMFEHATGVSGQAISLIALFAVINGALIQIIMASRVLYGSAVQGWMPSFFGSINLRTNTPMVATVVVTMLIVIFALWLPLGTLARLTSLVILIVFVMVNLALVKIKQGESDRNSGVDLYSVPFWVPITGALASAIFVLVNLTELVG